MHHFELESKLEHIVTMAGQLLLSHFRKPLDVKIFAHGGLQTNVDLLSEDFLKQELSALIPGSGFVAEESSAVQGNDYTWVIDPLDGTRNFVRGIPYFCISIALVHKEKTIVGVVYQPITCDFFYASAGRGAFLNKKRIVRISQDSNTALVVVSDFLCRQSNILESLKLGLKPSVQGLKFRVNGAVALDLAFTATGSFDCVIFQNLSLWDRLAGMLLVHEAGGTVLYPIKSGLLSSTQVLIAGNDDLCQNFAKNLKKNEK